jgi:hypothetical protein
MVGLKFGPPRHHARRSERTPEPPDEHRGRSSITSSQIEARRTTSRPWMLDDAPAAWAAFACSSTTYESELHAIRVPRALHVDAYRRHGRSERTNELAAPPRRDIMHHIIRVDQSTGYVQQIRPKRVVAHHSSASRETAPSTPVGMYSTRLSTGSVIAKLGGAGPTIDTPCPSKNPPAGRH